MHVRVLACMCVLMFLCMHVSACVRMYQRVCVCVCALVCGISISLIGLSNYVSKHTQKSADQKVVPVHFRQYRLQLCSALLSSIQSPQRNNYHEKRVRICKVLTEYDRCSVILGVRGRLGVCDGSTGCITVQVKQCRGKN